MSRRPAMSGRLPGQTVSSVLELRCVAPHPAHNGRMRHRQAALGHQSPPKSRRLSLNRRYQRTHKMITSRSKWRPRTAPPRSSACPLPTLSQFSRQHSRSIAPFAPEPHIHLVSKILNSRLELANIADRRCARQLFLPTSRRDLAALASESLDATAIGSIDLAVWLCTAPAQSAGAWFGAKMRRALAPQCSVA